MNIFVVQCSNWTRRANLRAGLFSLLLTFTLLAPRTLKAEEPCVTIEGQDHLILSLINSVLPKTDPDTGRRLTFLSHLLRQDGKLFAVGLIKSGDKMTVDNIPVTLDRTQVTVGSFTSFSFNPTLKVGSKVLMFNGLILPDRTGFRYIIFQGQTPPAWATSTPYLLKSENGSSSGSTRCFIIANDDFARIAGEFIEGQSISTDTVKARIGAITVLHNNPIFSLTTTLQVPGIESPYQVSLRTTAAPDEINQLYIDNVSVALPQTSFSSPQEAAKARVALKVLDALAKSIADKHRGHRFLPGGKERDLTLGLGSENVPVKVTTMSFCSNPAFQRVPTSHIGAEVLISFPNGQSATLERSH